MSVSYTTNNIHWSYFLSLEQDLLQSVRYVEPCSDNEGAFSVEYARIIMSATQESDVVLKALSNIINPDEQASSIRAYWNCLSELTDSLGRETIYTPRFGLQHKPWQSWEEGSPPEWWTANNKIKHHRATEYHRASQKNAFASVSGLMVLIGLLKLSELKIIDPNADEGELWWKATDELISNINLLRFNEDYYRGTVTMGAPSQW